MKLIIATANKGKLQEITELLWPLGFEIESDTREVEETGGTLEENALIKAREVAKFHAGSLVIADDSGLEVSALGGEPGVFSARYAGAEKDTERNNLKLLDAMHGKSDRSAQFRTVIALIGEGEEHLFEGVVKGKIIEEKRGSGGFGYDPVFVPDGFDRTFAQMLSNEKNAISHRALAMKKLVEYLAKK